MAEIIKAPEGFEFVITEGGKILYHVPCEGEWFLCDGKVFQAKDRTYYGYYHILLPIAPDQASAPVAPATPSTGADAGGAACCEIRPDHFAEDVLAWTVDGLQLALAKSKEQNQELRAELALAREELAEWPVVIQVRASPSKIKAICQALESLGCQTKVSAP